MEYKNWPCESLSRGDLQVLCLPQLGGRIISIKYKGQECLFTQQEHIGELYTRDELTDYEMMKKRLGFRLWGGDKTWVSPQSDWVLGIPPLDLDAGPYSYQLTADGIIMQSDVCRETGVIIHREVRLLDDNKIDLIETLINTNTQPVKRSVWNVTQILKPAVVSFKADYASVKAFDNEGESVALKEGMVKQREEWVDITCNKAAHFKYGAVLSEGLIETTLDNNIKWTRTFHTDQNESYAHDCTVEVFNSPDYPYLEVEVHAPFWELGPDEAVTLSQQWTFYS